MIDCLIIGPNETNVNQQVKRLNMIGGVSNIPGRILRQITIPMNNNTFSAPGIITYLQEQDYSKAYDSISMPKILSPAILELSTYLHNKGVSYDYVNLFLREKEELANKLRKDEILTIAITTTLYTSLQPIWEIISFIKKYNKKAKIIIGGPFIFGEMRSRDRNSMEKLFNALDADIYVDNSLGEDILYQIIMALKSGKDMNHIPNIFYKTEKGYMETIFEQNPIQSQVLTEGWKLWGNKVGDFAYVKTAQSCPFSCAFCEFSQRGGKYQVRSIESIENQLNDIEKYTKVKSVVFVDDTFNFPSERFKAILRMMIKNKYRFKWSSFFRCQNVDQETMELMVESKCEFLKIGLESGNQQVLDNMNKRTTVEEYSRGLELIKKYNIPHWTSFMVGFPGETYESVNDTINFIETLQPMFYRVSPWYCSPFTPIWKQREKYGLDGERYSWKHNTMDIAIAMELADQMVLKIEKSLNLPFMEEDIIALNHKGVAIDEILNFSKNFNQCVKANILNQQGTDQYQQMFKKMQDGVQMWG